MSGAIFPQTRNKFLSIELKWAVPCPDNETVLKVGVYKAVQQCRSIGEDVKRIAAEKCAAMGFSSDMYGVKGDE